MDVVQRYRIKQNGGFLKKKMKHFVCVLALHLLCSPVTAYAASTTADMAQYPGVTISPDGSNRAWTTDYGDKTDERLPDGYTINTGVESALTKLNAGEHYYKKEAAGSVPIGKWEVAHSPGQCIHDTPLTDSFAGFQFNNSKCGSLYNNGWLMYCADCNDLIANMLVYGKSDTVRNITAVPASGVYVYFCPHCNHMEQGSGYQHLCNAISKNRYKITYRNNAPADSTVAGYMSPTLHMFDNSTVYNGQPSSEIGYTDTKLRKNTLSSKGYVFTGWNTKADGSGQSFTDGQEVLNLTLEENGTVKLYAQWKKSESTLVVDAEGGTYNGQPVFEQKQKYDTTYRVDTTLLVPAKGYTVSFITNGGSGVADITTTKSFSHWEVSDGFQGEFTDNVYRYVADDNHKDTITAQYINDDLTLPACTGNNVSLVGWYDSLELKDEDYVGKAGDQVSVSKDTVLYAKWAQLTLWTYEDYDSYGGTGAVDLKWEQKDGKSKYYRLFQSLDNSTWKEILGSDIIESNLTLTENFTTSQQGKTYNIPYTGNYTITASGGKGADYNGSLVGGKGGSVSASYWLFKGDTITVYPGSSGSGQTGGSNGSSAKGGSSPSNLGRGGGAASLVYVTRNGTKTLLLVAGGGGGANGYASGGAGGTGGGNGTISNGADGVGGGGGGRTGGKAGSLIYHHHTGSSSGGGCYIVYNQGHHHSGSCYTDYIDNTGNSGTWYDSCGCSHEVHYWRCSYCGDTDTSQTNSSAGCREGHNESDDGGPLDCHDHVLTCGKSESGGYYTVGCGYEEGGIESAGMSYGGTNYIADVYGCKNQSSKSGTNNGAGNVTLQSADIGYLETNRLDNVAAMDLAEPDKIQAYKEALSGDKRYRIILEQPNDNGTVYYHKAESYESGTINLVAVSNITENRIISGIAGYRYYIDGNSNGTVTGSHAFMAGNEIDITMQAKIQYLHVAAVDIAGNIGPSVSIQIPSCEDETDKDIVEEYVKVFPPMTDVLALQASDSVYPSGVGSYFIKADEKTEHVILAQGYLNGKATNKYQVDMVRLASGDGSEEEWYQVTVPKVDTSSGDRAFANEEIMTNASKEELTILNVIRAAAIRTEQARVVSITEYFTITPEHDGKTITVYPRALSEFEGKIYESDIAVDKTHGITLIPDGEAPVIYGMEALEQAGNINMTEEEKQYVIHAEDSGSGVRNLTVTITNVDNQLSRTYSSDSGSVIITMKRDDYLFLGDFVVTAEAVDNVDNHRISGSDKVAFTLEAEIERSREPKEADFKAGDGAVITVTTGGYAEKLIIRFPESLVNLKPDINREYVYEFPEAIKTEIYEFNIPLDTPDGYYVIEVEAWKNGEMLREELALPINTKGSITEEFRTRIRDNGV